MLIADLGKNKPEQGLGETHEEPPEPYARQWTVMILRGVGKALNFRVSPRLVFWSLLPLLVYFLVSVVVLVDYLDKVDLVETQMRELKNLNHQIQETQRDLFRANQRVAILEDYISELENGGEIPDSASAPKDTPAPKKALPKSAITAAAGPSSKETEKAVAGPIVDVTQFKATRQLKKLTVDFRLVKVSSSNDPVKGYTHIIAVNREMDPPQWWSYPKAALRDGVPLDHRHGQRFSIRRLKPFRGEFFADSMAELPSVIKVLVYDEPGKRIFEKEYDLNEMR